MNLIALLFPPFPDFAREGHRGFRFPRVVRFPWRTARHSEHRKHSLLSYKIQRFYLWTAAHLHSPPIVAPPSMTIVVPVMKRPAGEASKSAAPAMSWGSPIMFSGL